MGVHRRTRSATAVAMALLLAAILPLGCGGEGNGTRALETFRTYSVEEFLATTDYRGLSFSPDGARILISSDRTGVYNAFAIPVNGDEPEQLTHSTGDAVMAAAYFPTDERFIYTSDQGGNELNHVYVRTPDGETVDLTPGEGHRARFLWWAQDDRSFFVATNERNPRYMDLYEVHPENYARTLFYDNKGGFDVTAISPDRRLLALVRTNTDHDTEVFLLDRDTGVQRHLTPHQGQVYYEPQTFSPDGRYLYYLTNQGDEFRYLARYDLEQDGSEVVVKAGWDVLGAAFSKDGERLVVRINADARTEVRVYDYPNMGRLALPQLPEADLTSVTFSRDGDLMAFYASSGRHPRDLFVTNPLGDSPQRLTRSLSPKIDADHLVDGEVVRFNSFDGTVIPAILYRPVLAGPDAPAPALVWVHGGPGGQARISYRALLQFLVNQGYAVLAINNRGSSGYGKTFYALDDRNHGQGDLDDCVAGADFLAETGFVDPERIAIGGGSYGGYMVLAALAFRPEAFVAGVDLFGISNWIRTLESIPPWWESERNALYREIGDPIADRAYLESISPLFHATNIVRPLLVLQGANDPRVIQVESDEIVDAVRDNGVPVEYLIFEDEGHGFRKRENRIEGYETILRFLETHVAPPAEEPEEDPDAEPGEEEATEI